MLQHHHPLLPHLLPLTLLLTLHRYQKGNVWMHWCQTSRLHVPVRYRFRGILGASFAFLRVIEHRLIKIVAGQDVSDASRYHYK